jgi:hypothetical protein
MNKRLLEAALCCYASDSPTIGMQPQNTLIVMAVGKTGSVGYVKLVLHRSLLLSRFYPGSLLI